MYSYDIHVPAPRRFVLRDDLCSKAGHLRKTV